MSAVLDHLAAQQLVLDHLPLVDALARRAAQRLPRWLDIDDLIQTGRIGLMQAASRFDPARGIKFSSYASKRILGAIYDAHRRKNYHYELHEELDIEKADEAPGPLHDQSKAILRDEWNHPTMGVALRNEVRGHLSRLMRDLTDDERHAVVQHALHDMQYSRIGMSRSRSTTWAFRQAESGHAKMRVLLRRVGIDGLT